MKHRTFHVDRCLDNFKGWEPILRGFLGIWEGRLQLDVRRVDVDGFKRYLEEVAETAETEEKAKNADAAKGTKQKEDAREELMAALYQANDLADERGHEELVSACRAHGIEPDPATELPVEVLALKVYTEHRDQFDHAYARYAMWKAERFCIFRVPGGGFAPLTSPEAVEALRTKLKTVFKREKTTEDIIIRPYREGVYFNLVVSHQKRTKSELVIRGHAKPRVVPMLLRPVQQDYIRYNVEKGQVEIEAGRGTAADQLRMAFAAHILGNEKLLESPAANKCFELGRIGAPDFTMHVPEGHTATLVELHFRLKQVHAPAFQIRSANVLETLDANHLRRRIDPTSIKRAFFKITFPDDARGKRVELYDTNGISFKRATHADEIFELLRAWQIAV